MQSSVKNWVMAGGLVILGVAVAAGGIYVGDLDDAPGAGVGGILLGLVAGFFAVRIARRKT